MLSRVCLYCNKKFNSWPYILKEGGGKYCSRQCSGKMMRGKTMHPNTRQSLDKVIYKTGRGTIKEKQYTKMPDGTTALKINLTKGKFAIIDEDDFERVNQYKWHYHKNGYALRGFHRKNIAYVMRMHRFINNTPDGFDTDHINENKLDNRKHNLRSATRSENMLYFYQNKRLSTRV